VLKAYGGTPGGYPKADYVCPTILNVRGDGIVSTYGQPYLADKPYNAAIVGGTGRFAGASAMPRSLIVDFLRCPARHGPV